VLLRFKISLGLELGSGPALAVGLLGICPGPPNFRGPPNLECPTNVGRQIWRPTFLAKKVQNYGDGPKSLVTDKGILQKVNLSKKNKKVITI